MKRFTLIFTVVLTTFCAASASAQRNTEVVPRTHWSFDVLKKLCVATDLTSCLPDEKHISAHDFFRSNFYLTRQQAALAVLKLDDRLQSRTSSRIKLTYWDAENPKDKSDIGNLEAKDVLQALFMEYKEDIKAYGVGEKWLQHLNPDKPQNTISST